MAAAAIHYGLQGTYHRTVTQYAAFGMAASRAIRRGIPTAVTHPPKLVDRILVKVSRTLMHVGIPSGEEIVVVLDKSDHPAFAESSPTIRTDLSPQQS